MPGATTSYQVDPQDPFRLFRHTSSPACLSALRLRCSKLRPLRISALASCSWFVFRICSLGVLAAHTSACARRCRRGPICLFHLICKQSVMRAAATQAAGAIRLASSRPYTSHCQTLPKVVNRQMVCRNHVATVFRSSMESCRPPHMTSEGTL